MIRKKTLRHVLAFVSGGITVACLIAIVFSTQLTPLGIDNLPFNDVTSKSVDLQLGLSETLFQVGLLMLGALWGLVIAKKDEVHLVFSRRSELVMFVGSSALLLLSLCSYGIYIRKVARYIAVASVIVYKNPKLTPYVPDIFDQNVNYLFACQIVSLIAGTINGMLTLVSTHRLRE